METGLDTRTPDSDAAPTSTLEQTVTNVVRYGSVEKSNYEPMILKKTENTGFSLQPFEALQQDAQSKEEVEALKNVEEVRSKDVSDDFEAARSKDVKAARSKDDCCDSQQKPFEAQKLLKTVNVLESTNASEMLLMLCGALCCLIAFAVIANIISIASIVIGTLYLHNCPADKYIPIYLLVQGCVGMFHATVKLCSKSSRTDEEVSNKGGFCACLDGLLGIFMLAWFIAGSVWVFRAYAPNTTDTHAANFCNATLYYFSFVILCIAWTGVGIVVVVSLLACVCMCCKAAFKDK